MSRDYHGPDPAGTGAILSVEDDVWVLIHPGGRVEWIGDAQDRAELRARLIAERDQARTRSSSRCDHAR